MNAPGRHWQEAGEPPRPDDSPRGSSLSGRRPETDPPGAVLQASAAPTIGIRLDGRPCTVPAGTTLSALVDQLGHAAAAVTTAVNEHFVPRAERAGQVLQPGDAVLLFQAIVGG